MSEETHAPTQGEAAQVGVAGAHAVNPETQTEAEAKVAASEAMNREARKLEIRLAPDALDQMADTFIKKLTEVVEFRKEGESKASETTTQETKATTESAKGAATTEPQKQSLASRLLRE